MCRLIFFICLISAVSQADFPVDKVAHFSVAYAAAYTVPHLFPKEERTEAYIFSAVAVLALGFAKESGDQRFDWGDIGANTAGVLGAGIILQLE